MVFNNWSITYKKLLHTVEVVAANLRHLGIQPGERVSIMLPNLPRPSWRTGAYSSRAPYV